MATLKELALSGEARIPYWQSTSTGSSSITGTEPQKTSKWKTALANIWAGLSGKVQLTTKDFGSNDPYNDGSDYTDSGRFVSNMERINRFHKGNENGSAANSQVFIDGFEDPTHLTFKVEFGEWGASINDNATIAAIQRASIATNTLFMDYDCFPMGLLDLNFTTPTSLKFNEQTLYNVYNWLSSRNEDRRAQYIRDFIWGIYDIQRSMPYIFSKISGIDKLTDFDSTRGQRLKDVTLTLTCLPDGIDLKMRTLMELYRKAAWNDVYQRWEIPDIYRYFKMIIYVFDDRSLHMGGGLFSPDQDAFPIYALECGPCEFVIKNHNNQEYSLNYQDVKENETTIDIKVYNIKTLMANQMFKNVKYINDLITNEEHWAQKDANATKLNGQSINWKYVWMQRLFMMPDEYNAYYRPTEEWDALSHYFADENDDAQFPINYATIEMPDNTWHQATVTDTGYVINSWKSLWNAVKSIVTSNTTLIRDSRQSDRYFFKNDLNHLNSDTFQYYAQQNLVNIDIDSVKDEMQLYIKKLIELLKNTKMNIDTSHPINSIDSSIDLNLDKPNEDLINIDLNLVKMDELIDSSLYSGELPDMILKDIEINDDKIEQHLSELMLNLVKISLNLNYIEPNLDKLNEELQPLNLNLDLATQELLSIDKNLDNIKQTLVNINKNLLKPDMKLVSIDKDLRRLELSLASLLINLETPLMKMNSLDKNLDKLKQELQDMLINLDKQVEVMSSIDLNLDKQVEELIGLKLNLSKIAQDVYYIIKNLKKPSQTLQDINKNLDKENEKLVEIDKNLDKQDEELTPIDLNLEKQIEELTSMIINLQKLNEKLIEPLFNNEHNKMDVSTHLIINDSIDEMSMTSPVFNTYKNSDMLMNTVDSTVDIEHSPLIETNFNTDKNTIEFNEMNSVQNTTDSVKQSMTDASLYTSVNHSPMISPVIDTSITHSLAMNSIDLIVSESDNPMTEMIINDSVTHNAMIEQSVNDSVNHSPMILLSSDSSVIHNPLINAELNTDHQSLVMTSTMFNTDKNNMSMISSDVNSEHLFNNIHNSSIIINNDKNIHPMIDELIIESNNHSSIDFELVNNEHQNQSPMILSLYDNSKDSSMNMQEMNNSEYITDSMKMNYIEQSSQKRDNNGMTQIHSDNNINEELSDVELVKNVEKTQMEMKPLELNLTKVEDLVDVELVHNDALENMKMEDINSNVEKTLDVKMPEIDRTELQLIRNDISMNSINSVEQQLVSSDSSKMNDIKKNKEKADINISDSKIDRVENAISSQASVMKPIISEKLSQRIMNLVSLDVDSLKDASVEDMNKLIGIMEQTVKDVKTEMNMTEVKKNINKDLILRSQMTLMVGYKHHDFGDDLIKVDANAFERGRIALKNAQDRMKMNGLRDK